MLKKLEWDSLFFNKEIYTFDEVEDLKNLNKLKNYIIQKKIDNKNRPSEVELKEKKFKYISGHTVLELSNIYIYIY